MSVAQGSHRPEISKTEVKEGYREIFPDLVRICRDLNRSKQESAHLAFINNSDSTEELVTHPIQTAKEFEVMLRLTDHFYRESQRLYHTQRSDVGHPDYFRVEVKGIHYFSSATRIEYVFDQERTTQTNRLLSLMWALCDLTPEEREVLFGGEDIYLGAYECIESFFKGNPQVPAEEVKNALECLTDRCRVIDEVWTTYLVQNGYTQGKKVSIDGLTNTIANLCTHVRALE